MGKFNGKPEGYVDNITCLKREEPRKNTVPSLDVGYTLRYTDLHVTTNLKYGKTSTYDTNEFDEENDTDVTVITTVQAVTKENQKERDRLVTRYMVISLAGFFTIATITGIIVAKVIKRKMALEHAEKRVATE